MAGPGCARRPLALPVLFATLAWACASGEDGPGGGPRDGGGTDGSSMSEGGSGDGGGGGDDAGPTDSGTDAGPSETARTCEACEVHEDCQTGSYCVTLSVGGKACVPSCVPDIPTCPRAFSCVLDVASGVDTTVCLPVGGTCCVDEDADGYGQGVGCMGGDCEDLDETINPGMDEICDGVDQDCDGTADDPPTDCVSGRCTDDGDGTYTSVTGADCTDAMCSSGTETDCGDYTCVDGGESGNTCATDCAPGGTDDDTYCVESAHCDGGACVPDVPNGMACDEDGDCVAGHCDNGFCCSTGTCCATTSDCPGGGGVSTICENSMTCQGSRGETECTAEFQCRTTSGIPDDSACTATTRALTCGLYDEVYCTGDVDQDPPVCPTACLGDTDCIDAAHCEYGFCVPDRPPGSSCSRNPDCQDGLYCVDGVCCTSACTGTCQSCNLVGSAGSCVNIPAGADPGGECPGFSCASYYDGFGAGEDACYRRQDVSGATATCNGAGACIDPATLCSAQPRGPLQIDCHNTCQSPVSGTCTGTTAGACNDLDDPAVTTTCGMGACARTVQECTGGAPTTCTPGTPVAESCNGIDDDCNGTIDNGSASTLCPPPTSGASTECSAGACRLASCPSGMYDVDADYTNGCECTDDGSGNTCGAALTLGNLGVGASATHNGVIIPGQEDWFTVGFSASGRGSSQGAPTISVAHSGGGANPFRLEVAPACGGTPFSCGEGGMAGAVTSYSFRDNQSLPGARQWSGPHSVAWPSTVMIRVTRTDAATTCSAARYTLTVSR